MWNKRQDEPGRPAGSPPAGSPPTSQPFPAAPFVATPSTGPVERRDAAAVGASITIAGDITGDEDLTILGHVEGKVDLPQHVVTVGQSGRVKADIRGRVISVAGEVRGNLVAAEQILIRKTATMLGNLTAPRVGLEDGCSFRGSVEMESVPEKSRASAPRNSAANAPAKPPATSPAATSTATPPASAPTPSTSSASTPSPSGPGDGGGPVKSETPSPRP
jgi:cytoskeletal protein CcmA (bactofilin family)